ncbi:hypothetical protein [Psychromonas sp. MME2]|uniref:hypothetical protein n=1 Tax=unclassified Psychromonas TaxID=2614957 RepID=UPI00339C0559
MSLGKVMLMIFLLGIGASVIVPRMPSNTSEINWTNAKKGEVCKAYIGSIMKKPTSIMTHYKSDDNGYVYVKYTGKWFNGDTVTFQYVCDIDSSSIEYAQWLIEDKSMGMIGNKWGDWKEKVKYDYNIENRKLSFVSPKTSQKIYVTL